MWKKIVIFIAVILLLAGVGFLLYPTISNEIGKAKANEAIDEFQQTAKDSVEELLPPDDKQGDKTPAKSYAEALEKGYIDKEGYPVNSSGQRTSSRRVVFHYDLNKLHADSIAYNRSIINNQGTVDTSDFSKAALNMSSYGLSNFYGYVSAPSIGLQLPVYLGANESMMSYGAAHLCNTSLPLDETDTTCAIAAHTGYIGRIFFDNIKHLKIGDRVTVTNYWEDIEYKVIETKTVSPRDINDTYIQPNRQLLTLITCITNNGVTNRYVVVCEKK